MTEINPELIAAARTIACCVDLFCNVERVINIALLLEEDAMSKDGKLKEDEATKKLRTDRLAK